MAKIIVTFNGLIQQEVSINKSRITIGRRSGNDIVIDHLTVSGQHAAIDTTSNGSFVLDLGSTNGTTVNNQPVKKHLLQNDDVIDIGEYKLRYQQEKNTQGSVISGNIVQTGLPAVATIRVVNGANAGKELILSKPVTTIGNPGIQVVAIAKQADQYVRKHVEGAETPKVNGKPISDPAQILRHGDMIDVAGIHMQITFKY